MVGAVAFVHGQAIRVREQPGEVTSFVLLASMVASSGGLIFGYGVGVSGSLTRMDSFVSRFFPSIHRQNQVAAAAATDKYCRFDSQLLILFASSLYVIALFAALFASHVTRAFGRRRSILVAGVAFLVGSVVSAAALNLPMLIAGRLFLGVGIGFAIQSVPVYLSEIAPAKSRGMVNMGFQLMTTIGIITGNLVNDGAIQIRGGWGWRLSLGLAVLPAVAITIGAFFLPETPNSLMERGRDEDAQAVLRRIREDGEDVREEFDDLVAASRQARRVEQPWSNILQRRYRPQLAMAILIPLFQQATGIAMILSYAPELFKVVGFGQDAVLASAVLLGLVNVSGTFIAILTADKIGRRALFLQGGIQMCIAQVVAGTLVAIKFGTNGEARELSKVYASAIVLFIYIFVAAFAWSWGPLGWLLPSEIFPLEIRSVGQSIAVAVNMLFTFIITHTFQASICGLKFGSFYVFGGWLAVMTVFVAKFLPETKRVPMEEMVLVWREHWFWQRFIGDDDVHVGNLEVAKKNIDEIWEWEE